MLKNLYQEKILYKYFCYFLIYLIIGNTLINLTKNDSLHDINLFDLFLGFFLFLFLYFVGDFIKNIFKFETISIGIIAYLFSFFIFDCLVLFFYKDLLFFDIIKIVNSLWLLLFVYKQRNLNHLLKLTLSFFTLRISFNYFISNLTVNKNITGDVNAVFFEQSKNIYEFSYFYSVNNYVFEGYPQFTSYIQSLFLAVTTNVPVYNFYSFTSHIVYYLSVLLFFELKISKFNKFLLTLVFSSIIINSSFIKFLMTTSLMSEGLVSLFTVITLVSILNNYKTFIVSDYKLFILLGIMYFSKQFNSSLVIILVTYLFVITKFNKIVLFGYSSFILKELLFIFVFKDISKDHHIKQMDVVDTLLDLLLFRDLKIENFILIIKNLWIDKPITLIFVIFYLAYIFNTLIFKNSNNLINTSFILININIIFVFLLYISVWRNMELESPIRYFLNYFHLILITSFQNIEMLKIKEPKTKT